ncbi:hypothetical protein MTP99_015529 [Tenebrio molitor]|jgi:large subunit ribosomal protein L33|nr:hypothetical protein MTP99_015529 [Tenebrio molitor]
MRQKWNRFKHAPFSRSHQSVNALIEHIDSNLRFEIESKQFGCGLEAAETIMFLTNILLKRVKSKRIMVEMESVVSGHRFNKIRERLADKLEVIRFDPFLQKECVYREKKKIRSLY